MRAVEKIVIHCSATKPDHDVTVAEIDGWHKARGFAGFGYHALIALDGAPRGGRELDAVGAHA